ncbi:MAG: hypothetical protein ACRCU5_16195, partial [Rhizobiaceae bacterium]
MRFALPATATGTVYVGVESPFGNHYLTTELRGDGTAWTVNWGFPRNDTGGTIGITRDGDWDVFWYRVTAHDQFDQYLFISLPPGNVQLPCVYDSASSTIVDSGQLGWKLTDAANSKTGELRTKRAVVDLDAIKPEAKMETLAALTGKVHTVDDIKAIINDEYSKRGAIVETRAPTATDIHPKNTVWQDISYGTERPLEYLSKGPGVWESQNSITLEKLRVYVSFALSNSLMNLADIKVLRADRSAYPQMWKMGSQSGTVAPGFGQFYTGQSVHPPGRNTSGWFELVPRSSADTLSGFGGVMADFNSQGTTQITRFEVFYTNGFSRSIDVAGRRWGGDQWVEINPVPFPVGSNPPIAAQVDLTPTEASDATGKKFGRVSGEGIAAAIDTHRPHPDAQHDFGIDEAQELTLPFAHLEGGGGYSINGLNHQKLFKSEITNTSNPPVDGEVSFEGFDGVFFVNSAPRVQAVSPIVVKPNTKLDIEIVVNGETRWMNLTISGAAGTAAQTVDLTPYERIADATKAYYKIVGAVQSLSLIDLVIGDGAGAMADTFPATSGRLAGDVKALIPHGATPVTALYEFPTVVDRVYETLVAVPALMANHIGIRAADGTTMRMFTSPNFAESYPDVTMTVDGDWRVFALTFVAAATTFAGLVSISGTSLFHGPVLAEKIGPFLMPPGGPETRLAEFSEPINFSLYALKTDLPEQINISFGAAVIDLDAMTLARNQRVMLFSASGAPQTLRIKPDRSSTKIATVNGVPWTDDTNTNTISIPNVISAFVHQTFASGDEGGGFTYI